MSTLYRPVLIQTADQAAALPIGTVAEYHDEDSWRDVAVKVARNDWRSAGSDPGMDWSDAYLIDWTALVPVEVEEEMRVTKFHLGTITADGARFDDRTGEPTEHERRLVTPWQSERDAKS